MNYPHQKHVLLVTPPFTQINTPYPATQYIKGYLNTLGVSSFQSDLSLETILQLFSSDGLTEMFARVKNKTCTSEQSQEILKRKELYITRIDPVIEFLQGRNQTLSHVINSGNFLPVASRFSNAEDLEWAFGELGNHDKAKHLATLFLEEIGDFIKNEIDEDFGFSRYAERISRSASDFTPIYNSIKTKNTIITDIIKNLTQSTYEKIKPAFVCITAPFPGNVFGAFLIASTIKKLNPDTICILGGGYVNTELRSLSDERVFEFFDYITLDDGETPLKKILEKHLSGISEAPLKRTFICHGGVVMFCNNATEKDVPQREVGTPDYTGLWLDKYVSVLEVLNPMHRMWSDGRWNKLTLAHGCYWGKCTFCDVSLDYIARYEPVDATILCERIENIIDQTGERGFHFVDEAAPPALLKELAIELIKRKISITWWTNIRFEKSFSSDLCRLLSLSGCIAVTGGLEVASDRLLELIKKGVTVKQVAQVAHHFTKNEILVHAYLMYGFPTQSEQETIDSLEIVRQMFQNGIIKSGFWHLFAMTSHSPVGLNPSGFNVTKTGPVFEGFADNDCYHEDLLGCDHEKFSEGLRVSLLNYMQGIGVDLPLQHWFDFQVPKPSIPRNLIQSSIQDIYERPRPHQIMIWTGGECSSAPYGAHVERVLVRISNPSGAKEFEADNQVMMFLLPVLEKINIFSPTYIRYTVESFMSDFKSLLHGEDYSEFTHSYLFYRLREAGLIIV